MKTKLFLFKSYFTMLMWDLLAGSFDGKYKQYRRQSKRVMQILKTSLILNKYSKNGYITKC